MTTRYFVPQLPAAGGVVLLPQAEVQHATRVMRIQCGDRITLFDGKGFQAEATVTQVSRNECVCDSEASAAIDREPMRTLHFGIALPKPDRAKELIERLTELGVKSVTPLTTARTQRPPSGSLLEKLRRGVIEACKQSGRNVLMEIGEVRPCHEFFCSPNVDVRLIAHPMPDATALRSMDPDIQHDAEIAIAIGPEGGWTDEELALAKQERFQPVHLGKRIYRIETAATAIAAMLV